MRDLCKQFVIPEVVSLAEDPVFRVRKATALNFHNVCKIGGEHELFERLRNLDGERNRVRVVKQHELRDGVCDPVVYGLRVSFGHAHNDRNRQ